MLKILLGPVMGLVGTLSMVKHKVSAFDSFFFTDKGQAAND